MGIIARVFPRQAPSFAIWLSHALPTRRVDAWRNVLGGLRTAYQESVQLDKRSEASIFQIVRHMPGYLDDSSSPTTPTPGCVRPSTCLSPALPCLVRPRRASNLFGPTPVPSRSLTFACRSCVSIAFSGGSLASNLVVSEAPSFKHSTTTRPTSSLIDSRLPQAEWVLPPSDCCCGFMPRSTRVRESEGLTGPYSCDELGLPGCDPAGLVWAAPGDHLVVSPSCASLLHHHFSPYIHRQHLETPTDHLSRPREMTAARPDGGVTLRSLPAEPLLLRHIHGWSAVALDHELAVGRMQLRGPGAWSQPSQVRMPSFLEPICRRESLCGNPWNGQHPLLHV